MTTTPPGWYDDGRGDMRWWDGDQWTQHVAERVAAAEQVAPDMAETAVLPDMVAAPASTFATPAQQPPGSKLWIVWIVLGVVVLATIVAAGVLIAAFIGAAAQAARSGGAAGGSTPDDSAQQAAVAVVELYDDAWQDADCDDYFASTTENFRTQSGLTDCSAFEPEADAFDAATEDYEVTVTDVWEEGGDILVSTTETYLYLLDDDGEPLAEPSSESGDWLYTVVSEGGVWVIDNLE